MSKDDIVDYKDYKEWRKVLLIEPFNHGWNGIVLIFSTFLILLFFCSITAFFITKNNYNQIILIVGIMIGCLPSLIFFISFSNFFYKLKYTNN